MIIAAIKKGSFIRYGLAGIASYAFKAGVSYFLTDIFHIWYFYSYVITLAAVIAFNFFSSSLFIFKAGDQAALRFGKYLAFLSVFYLVDAGLVKLLTDIFSLHYQYSIFISTSSVFFVKYFVYKLAVFNKKEEMPL